MKRLLFSCLLAGLIAVPASAQTVPELPFESIPDPLTLPDDVHFGEIAGVAVNSKGHVFVFSRGNSTGPSYMATASQLLEGGREVAGGGAVSEAELEEIGGLLAQHELMDEPSLTGLHDGDGPDQLHDALELHWEAG